MSLATMYMTAPSRDDCLKIGRALLEKHLVACVNIIDGVTSLYWWEGKLEEATESVLIAKTQMRLVNACVAAIKPLHPYELPCITGIPVLKANPDYIRWVIAETEPTQDEA